MKNDEAWVSKFVSLLEEYAREEGLEFPHVPDSAGRRAYLRFLASTGCTEEELLPLVQHEKVTLEVREEVAALTMQALLNPKVREGPQFKDIIWLTLQMLTGRDNTNVIIHWLASTLHSELRDAGIQVPDHYPGVFPTDSFNAQCRIFDGEPLVLLDTGCLEMAEAVIITFLSRLAEADQADEISATVEQYVSTGARPDPFSSTMYGIDWGSLIVPSFVNSFERYVLAHEMGHLTLGHIKGGQVRQQSPQIGGAFEVAAKSQFDEFQADMWACQALIQRAQGVRESEFSVALALAGPIVALNVG